MAEAPGPLDSTFRLDRWKRLLGGGGRLRLRMQSSDMAPIVLPGDILELEEARLLTLDRDDIVLVQTRGICLLRRVCQRLLTEGGERFEVVADGLEAPPTRHGFEEILARLVCLEREGETLRPVGDSVVRARRRRRWRERWKNLWYGLLLRLGRESDSD